MYVLSIHSYVFAYALMYICTNVTKYVNIYKYTLSYEQK